MVFIAWIVAIFLILPPVVAYRLKDTDLPSNVSKGRAILNTWVFSALMTTFVFVLGGAVLAAVIDMNKESPESYKKTETIASYTVAENSPVDFTNNKVSFVSVQNNIPISVEEHVNRLVGGTPNADTTTVEVYKERAEMGNHIFPWGHSYGRTTAEIK